MYESLHRIFKRKTKTLGKDQSPSPTVLYIKKIEKITARSHYSSMKSRKGCSMHTISSFLTINKTRSVRLISQPISPTAYWALVTRPDRGRPTLHGWWAPVVLRYIKWWGAGSSRYEVHREPQTPPTNPRPI